MYIRNMVVGVILSTNFVFSAPAHAQAPSFDVEAVRAACAASADACLVAVEAAVAALRAAGLSVAELNTQLGVVAGTAVSAAAGLPAAEKAAFASVLNSIASASSNPAQIASLNALAADLQNNAGSVDLTAVAESFSES